MVSYLDNFINRLEEQSGAKAVSSKDAAVTLISQAKERLGYFCV